MTLKRSWKVGAEEEEQEEAVVVVLAVVVVGIVRVPEDEEEDSEENSGILSSVCPGCCCVCFLKVTMGQQLSLSEPLLLVLLLVEVMGDNTTPTNDDSPATYRSDMAAALRWKRVAFSKSPCSLNARPMLFNVEAREK